MTPPIRMVSVPVEPLWMMHVLGPDEIYPAPDHATAVEWCAYLNSEIAPKVPDVWCIGVPAIWTGTAEKHAEGLPEAIKGWTVPAAPAREPEGGAVEDALRRLRVLRDQHRNGTAVSDPDEYDADELDAILSVSEPALTPKEAPAAAGAGEAIKTILHEVADVEGGVWSFDHDMLVTASERIAALRAHPQAREEAQPVAWRYRTAPHRQWCVTESATDAVYEQADGSEVQPLFTTPPTLPFAEGADAEKLREKVEGIIRANVRSHGRGGTLSFTGVEHCAERILAALQQEGRPDA